MNAVLQIENLTIVSSEGTLVDNQSFTVSPGEPVTIIGETGSGKSLLAHTIIGDLPRNLQATGKVLTAGHDMLQAHATQSPSSLWGRTIVMLPQEPVKALSPLMKLRQQVGEVFRFIRNLSGDNAQTSADVALGRTGLTQAADKIPSQLSGGMAQRAAYTCVASTSAGIMIADEPTKGLDNHHKAVLGEELRQFAKTGTLLTITHDMSLAKLLGGKVIIMQKGKVLETGAAGRVLNTPRSTYGQTLLNALPENWTPLSTKKRSFAPLITLQDCAIRRGTDVIFDNVSLALGKGEIVGLTGDSGSGKSTLGNVLLGLLPADGKRHIAEPLARHNMLKIYQDPPNAFAKNVPVIQLLDDVIRLHQLDDSELDPLINELGLSRQLLQRHAGMISGGELQRVALLRALLLKPAFLVADEPASRLDPITSEVVSRLLVSSCRERQCTLLFISHDRQQLEKLCDRVIDTNSLRQQ